MSLKWSVFFILFLPVRPLSGLMASFIWPPFTFCCTQNDFHFPISAFFYKVRRPTSWTFGKISRYLLRSSGFHFDRLCSTFSEEAPEWSELDDHYHASFIECSIWYSQVSLLLLMGWLVNFSTLVWWNYCGLILVPWFFLERGSAVFGRTTSRLRAMTR